VSLSYHVEPYIYAMLFQPFEPRLQYHLYLAGPGLLVMSIKEVYKALRQQWYSIVTTF